MVEGLRVRLPHLLVRDSAVALEEMASRILERREVGGVGEHPGHELFDGDGGAEVDDVSDEVGRVDFGIVDLNHHPVFREPFLPNVDTDGGRQNHVADICEEPLIAFVVSSNQVRTRFHSTSASS